MGATEIPFFVEGLRNRRLWGGEKGRGSDGVGQKKKRDRGKGGTKKKKLVSPALQRRSTEINAPDNAPSKKVAEWGEAWGSARQGKERGLG